MMTSASAFGWADRGRRSGTHFENMRSGIFICCRYCEDLMIEIVDEDWDKLKYP